MTGRDDGTAGETRLLTVQRPPREEIRGAIRSYGGIERFDLRLWYVDRTTGEWKPGRGISLRLEEVALVAGALAEAATLITSSCGIRHLKSRSTTEEPWKKQQQSK